MTKAFFGLALGLAMSFSAMAQTVAVVDLQRVVAQLPQMAAIQQSLTQEFQAASEEIKKLESDIKFNMEKYQRESATMSQEQQEELRTTVQALQQEYQAKAQPLEQNVRRRQTEERNKILALVKQAVDAIAAEKKLDAVLNSQGVVFATPEMDISDLVAERVSKLN